MDFSNFYENSSNLNLTLASLAYVFLPNLHFSVSTEQRISSSYHRGWWHWVILQNSKLPTELGWRLLARTKPALEPTTHRRVKTRDCRNGSWTSPWWSHVQRWGSHRGRSDTAAANGRIKAHGSRICYLRTWRSWRNGRSRQLCEWGTGSVQVLQWAHTYKERSDLPQIAVRWRLYYHFLC